MTTSPPPARGAAQRELERLQRKVTESQRLNVESRARRDDLAFQMWNDGMPQDEIAARLDRADRAAGGGGVKTGTVQKSLFRLRKRREIELLP